MPSSEPSHEGRDFFTLAAELNFLPEETALQLSAEAATSKTHPTEIVLQKGLLDATQIDIIQTLLHPEEIVPDYEILDVLGKGGMGVVYRARQKSLNRIVALKTVLLSQMGDASMAARFEREAVTVAKLQHPNIVAAIDFGRHEGRLFLAMEYVDGKDMAKLITRQKQVSEANTLGFARQVAAGLAHAAQHGIVHRDIKPGNLLLVEPPEGFALPSGLPMVKITDFGLAFLTDEHVVETRLTSADVSVGSPHYMSPEQISGETIDQRADIYALGATMYHMLTGRPPFLGKTLSQIIAQKLNGVLPPVDSSTSKMSEGTIRLVKEMLKRNPAERIADYGQIISRIDAISGSKPSLAATDLSPGIDEETITINHMTQQPSASSTEVELPRNRGSHRTRPIVGATVTLASLLMLAWLIFYPDSASSPPLPPPRDMIPSGWAEPLFNGETLGALPSSGSWVVDEDNEGAIVISGTDGLIRRSLRKTDLGKQVPLENYRLLCFVQLHEAEAVELHFGISPAKRGNDSRSLIRVTKQGVSLGERASDRDRFQEVSKPVELSNDDDKYHAVSLEHQHGYWWVFFDEQLVGTVPPKQQPSLPEIRLSVEGGTAWFSDLQVEELVQPSNPEGT